MSAVTEVHQASQTQYFYDVQIECVVFLYSRVTMQF